MSPSPEHHPGVIGGTAITVYGRRLIADPMQRRLWTVTADESDLELFDVNDPRVDSLWSSGGMIVGETGQRVLAASEDGMHRKTVTPGLQEAR